MEHILSQKRFFTQRWSSIYLMLFGCCLITLCSLIKIPFYPVPMTLQTFAIFLIALTQSPKQAFCSVCCYLFCGTIGLPVFTAHSNPLWIVGKCGGYLVAFPIAAYIISRLANKYHPTIAILCGQIVIYLLGFLWLFPFFGTKVALLQGVVFFIPSALIKNVIASSITSIWKKA